MSARPSPWTSARGQLIAVAFDTQAHGEGCGDGPMAAHPPAPGFPVRPPHPLLPAAAAVRPSQSPHMCFLTKRPAGLWVFNGFLHGFTCRKPHKWLTAKNVHLLGAPSSRLCNSEAFK